MLKKKYLVRKALFALTALSSTSVVATAAVSASEADRLGNDLTPLGGIKAGNADGSIPAWTGGLTSPPSGYRKGGKRVDPFPGDQPIFTISSANAGQYSANLTTGHQALLKQYSSYKMPVYATRRTAAAPQAIYNQTKRIATSAQLINDGNGVAGAYGGIPFPIPQNGQEAIWNHLLRYRTNGAKREIFQAAPLRNGSYTLVRFADQFLFNFYEAKSEAEVNNVILYFRQSVEAPARLAGGILAVHETLDQVKERRRAWTYNPGQRRVRRAPNVAYDNPGTAADAQRTSDQFDMYNGAPDRYNWTLVGKKEFYVPYNAYKLHNADVKDVLSTSQHVNPALTRYEKHRCWVVDARLKEGKRHIYARRTFYIDEDSWQIVAADNYDGRGKLWRVSESHPINYYDAPVFWSSLETHIDLQNGRYLALGMPIKPVELNAKLSPNEFTPAALRQLGKR